MSMKTEMKDRRKKVTIISVIVAGLLIIIGITVAWFYQHQKAASLTQIAPPGKIIISGVHGSKLDQIDLSYNNENVGDNKQVTVRNVICIDSASEKITLKLAHTTNVDNLLLRIYPATESTSQPDESETYVKGTDAGTDYFYTYNSSVGYATKKETNDSDNMKQMTCLNGDNESNPKQALSSDEYHNKTYGKNETRVQNQAEPLYWTSNEKYSLPLNSKNENEKNAHIKYEYYGYFVLEASWTEQNKETDIVYVVADKDTQE